VSAEREAVARRWDAIVVGAGHNGLAAATVLGLEGWSVLVLERREEVGGLCAGLAFHPGYRHTGLRHGAAVPASVVEQLGLAQHGLLMRAAPQVWWAAPDGGGLVAPADPRLDAFVQRVAPFVRRLARDPVPRLDPGAPLWPLVERTVALRRLGRDVFQELLRVVPLPAEEWLRPLVPDPHARAALMLPALLGAYAGPSDPQTAALVLHDLALSGPEVVGGPAALVAALVAAARAQRAEIRTGVEVERLVVDQGVVRGVQLRGGEHVLADCVVSGLDPRRTLLDLVPPLSLPTSIEDEVRTFRVRSVVAKLHLALSQPPILAGRTTPVERFRVVADPAALDTALATARQGSLPTAPALDVHLPSLADPSLAPPGHAVLSAFVHGVPPTPGEGWTRSARKQLFEASLSALAGVCPHIAETVVASDLVVSPEIEARYGVSGGHPMHGEIALDQLWVGRPGPLLSRGRSPLPGLFLASSGTHPGGGVSAVPGILAARAVLEAS
jgi:phytoene dehydrogenase-like protein